LPIVYDETFEKVGKIAYSEKKQYFLKTKYSWIPNYKFWDKKSELIKELIEHGYRIFVKL